MTILSIFNGFHQNTMYRLIKTTVNIHLEKKNNIKSPKHIYSTVPTPVCPPPP